MSQFLHIFRKDVRHFWIEILISWCFLGLFVWRCMPTEDGGSEYSGFAFARLSSQLFGVLLILSWWVLLVRLVQDESLVGDRQFWVTRPYRWTILLPEKLVFNLLFVNIPLFAAQASILHSNGFAVLPYWHGLIWLQSLALAFFVAPPFLLSLVTATFVQVVLAALASALFILAHSAVVASVSGSSMERAPGGLDSLSGLVVIFAVVALVLLQYGWRRTLLARGVIASAAILLTIFALITPYESLIAKEFPRKPASPEPVRIELDRAITEIPFHAQRTRKPPLKIGIAIPILITAANPSEILSLHGWRIRFDASNGNHWQSNWQVQSLVIVNPNSSTYVTFELPRYLFESTSTIPMTVEVESALSIYRRKNSWRVIAQPDDFPAPRLGICNGIQVPTGILTCHAPIRGSTMLIGSIKSSESTCQRGKSEQPAPEAIGYYPSLGVGNGTLINPIVEETVSFPVLGLRWTDDNWKRQPRICAGTPINFSSLELVQRQSTTSSLPNIRLADYRLKPANDTGLGAVAVGAGFTLLH